MERIIQDFGLRCRTIDCGFDIDKYNEIVACFYSPKIWEKIGKPNPFERDIIFKKDIRKEDVRIIQWGNGKHYYAKIGTVDVVDDNGNQKWNTYREAVIAAQKFRCA